MAFAKPGVLHKLDFWLRCVGSNVCGGASAVVMILEKHGVVWILPLPGQGSRCVPWLVSGGMAAAQRSTHGVCARAPLSRCHKPHICLVGIKPQEIILGSHHPYLQSRVVQVAVTTPSPTFLYFENNAWSCQGIPLNNSILLWTALLFQQVCLHVAA